MLFILFNLWLFLPHISRVNGSSLAYAGTIWLVPFPILFVRRVRDLYHVKLTEY